MMFILKKALEKLKSRRLYVDIIASVTVIFTIISSCVFYYIYKKSSEELLIMAQEMLTTTSNSTIKNVSHAFEEAELITKIGGHLLTGKDHTINLNSQLINFMFNTLKRFPNFSSCYVSFSNGDFYQIRSLPKNSTYRTDPGAKLPKDVVYARRKIWSDSEGLKSETWEYLDENRRIVDKEELARSTYDPRKREWYRTAENEKTFVWSNLYVFSSSNQVGVTSTFPILNEQGIMSTNFSVDIELRGLTTLLKESRTSKEFTINILSDKGELVATTEENISSVKVLGDKFSIALISDFEKSLTYSAYNYYRTIKDTHFNFSHNQLEYITEFQSFSTLSNNSKWLTNVVIPIDYFVGKMRSVITNSLILGTIMFFFALFILFIFIRRISNPVTQIAEEFQRLKDFDVDRNVSIKTSIYELQILNHSMTALRHSMRAFTRYIPKSLVQKFLSTNQEITISGELKHITLLFTDIANFTTISETTPPEKLAQYISEYFEVTSQIITQLDGTIDKYIGDAIMAFWGAPLPDAYHTQKACRAALLIIKRLETMNKKWSLEARPYLGTRIGIHTGDCIVGNFGSSDRLAYTAMGDSVNLAARLEGVNKMYHTSIIISHEAYMKVKDYAVVRQLDIVAVKGKTTGVPIYELVGMMFDEPELIPSQSIIEFCNLCNEGFHSYVLARWDDAITTFEKVIAQFGSDPNTVILLERCREFKENPPNRWDGIVHLDKK